MGEDVMGTAKQRAHQLFEGIETLIAALVPILIPLGMTFEGVIQTIIHFIATFGSVRHVTKSLPTLSPPLPLHI